MPDFIDIALKDEEIAEERWRRALPRCSRCGWPIEDEDLYDVSGDLYCEDCMDKVFRKETRNYMDW